MGLVAAFRLEFRGVGVRLVNIARLHRQEFLLRGFAAYKLNMAVNPVPATTQNQRIFSERRSSAYYQPQPKRPYPLYQNLNFQLGSLDRFASAP